MKITLEKLWALKEFKPNDAQKNAILNVDGPLFLSAGPGSGKTRVLLWRTLNLIVFHNVKPEEIFLSTFTEKAAHQLKEGLKGLLGIVSNYTNESYDLSRMALGTVHSICNMLITDRRFSGGQRIRSPILLDELSQYFYVYNRNFWSEMLAEIGYENSEETNRIINNYLANRNSGSRHFAVISILSAFNRFSEEYLDPNNIQTKDEFVESLLKMYKFYLASLEQDKSVDFSLLQQRAYNTIKNASLQENVFKHIIIDEYQDTNTIQEKLFFELAKRSKNICVVGDDDQALYRFRGATVENLVEFDKRCSEYLNQSPHRIDLDTNYRSRKNIVSLYSSFIDLTNWGKEPPDKGFHRIQKKIKAHSKDEGVSVVVSKKAKAEEVYSEIACFVKEIKESGKVDDYNQIAFLFPAMKNNTRVQGFLSAFENEGIPVYAPRAGRFLEIEEARAVWGLFIKVFGKPKYNRGIGGGLKEFTSWLKGCDDFADWLLEDDSQLREYINDRKEEVETITNDYEILIGIVNRKKWDLNAPFKLFMIRDLIKPTNLSIKTKNNLQSSFLQNVILKREKAGNPFILRYIINRVTSVDWSVLDLFYRLAGFKYFRKMFLLAEDGTDEGPICNLGLITQYLARYMEQVTPIITASFLSERKFALSFFNSFTYALFRLGESEYEDIDDPFPKGRVPFLTIHQAKGLEFPVVVLGALYKQNRGASVNDIMIRDLLNTKGEPLDRMGEFDNTRMFYVALSRAQNLLVLPKYTHGRAASDTFKELFESQSFTEIEDFDIKTLPKSVIDENNLGKNYSYTGDYLQYYKCPRNYMIFKKYGFVPSRSQTMFFGNLVHQTIEDLHHLLIQERLKGIK